MNVDRRAYEGDIVSRLRHWRGLHLAHGGELFEAAADEIERLRNGAVNVRENDHIPDAGKTVENTTNHDAAPEARARDADRGRNDKAVTRPGEGTGNTPSKAEIDALEFVVEEGRTASVDDYGILRSWLIRLRPEWESQSYEESDEKRTNTTISRDATPSEGSVQIGDIVKRLRKWSNVVPVPPAAETMQEAAAEIACLREAIRRLADQDATLSVQGGSVTVTLDATLTDEERGAIEVAISGMYRPDVHHLTPQAPTHANTLRELLERLK